MSDRFRSRLVALGAALCAATAARAACAAPAVSSALLPPELLEPGPLGLRYWQWIAVPLVALLSWGAGMLLTLVSRTLLLRLASRTQATWDDEMLARTRGPMRLAWTNIVAFAAVPWLELNAAAQGNAHRALRALLLLSLFWAVLRTLTIAGQRLAASTWAIEHGASNSLIPLGTRVAKVTVVAFAFVVMLAEFDYPVASLIAGLGIGGLALALAAQKTVENLFGAFSIGIDQPIREGDFVKVEDFVGTVEAVGLRSTRIRTLDRTVISIPNGKLAEMRLETFAPRDRIRLQTTLGVVYETSRAQLKEILAGCERVLRDHAKIWPDTVVVRFAGFGASSLDIEVMAWFQTQSYDEFRDYRQEVLLGFMEVVEGAGSSFAFPTRTVHVAGGGSPVESDSPAAGVRQGAAAAPR